jgi:hypothetical protein
MNVRTREESSPEGRLAAIARIIMYRVVNLEHHLPDYADFREALKRRVEIELLIARLDEAQRKPRNEDRVTALIRELADLELKGDE